MDMIIFNFVVNFFYVVWRFGGKGLFYFMFCFYKFCIRIFVLIVIGLRNLMGLYIFEDFCKIFFLVMRFGVIEVVDLVGYVIMFVVVFYSILRILVLG